MENIHYKYTNKLINEKSPYLLQHAHNPVNWFPWSNEAFAESKKENKPIFLSIGYSTCHWCHVMEKESFEDEVIASLMNNIFISIKVDREERPDIDSLYMTVCQMLNGNGGWPLTIIMTPDKKPFFAGTYFPKYSVTNRIGMIDLIKEIDNAWKEEKDKIYESAEKITSYLISNKNNLNQDLLENSILDKAFEVFKKSFDKNFGGFGLRPKFPSPHNLSFLMRYYAKTKNNHALDMVTKTLTEMRKGGIFDQIGFGFHRYSTDQKWFLPHFEKMLYDQALLTIAFTEAFQITKNPLFEQTVSEILTYVLRDLTSKEGGFLSAEDADSEGEEGKFYLWSKNEILKILSDKDGELFCEYFNISESGNYYEEATHKFNGTNIPFIDGDSTKISERLESLRKKLFEAREKRIHPFKDDKILTDWNGLMISALALAGKVFKDNKYINAAEKAYKFILTNLSENSGKLFHRYRNQEVGIDGQLDDYSFFIWASLELFEATFQSEYLFKAIDLTEFVINNFWDFQNNSGFFLTSHLNSDLIIRPKEFYDGAIPSGNSVMYLNLIRLSKLTINVKYQNYADKLNSSYKNLVEKSPTGFSYFLSGLIFSFGPSSEVIITGGFDTSNREEILDEINQNFNPNKVVILVNEQNKNELLKILPFLKDYQTIDDKTTVFVCKNYNCNLPLNDKEKVIELIQSM